MPTLKRTVVVAVGLIVLVGTETGPAMAQTGNAAPAPNKVGEPGGRAKPTLSYITYPNGVKVPVLYPDLVPEKTSFETLLKSVGGVKVFEPIETDTTVVKLKKLQLAAYYQTFKLDDQVLGFGSWDVPFLNQLVENSNKFAQVASTLDPNNREQGIVFRKIKVVQFRMIEHVVYERVHTAQNLRAQQYFQVQANRLAAEIELYEYEFGGDAKAIPTATETTAAQHYGPLVNRSILHRKWCFCR